ncbi:dihydroorotase [Halorientalis marina]|uniref:dihydroorotase n=1 Tax=Halorientalis marina TaxID=2931976 RepID=UPI001FF22E6C|nr:dihydroorotase [Halorientalis marina]
MLIRNATLPDGRTRDVLIEGERIAAVGDDLPMPDRADARFIDATGKRLMPGMIDVHVHFRQPGFEHKETWATGSRSAAAGGVTTVVDQPNTDPPTTDGASFDEKAEFAGDSLVDYGINGGVTDQWVPSALFQRPLFALGEVFLADSTGDMGIDVDLFASAVKTASRQDVTVTVHAEDASEFEPGAKERDDADAWSAFRTARAEASAVRAACDVADRLQADVHIAHTSTPDGIDIADDRGVTCEVTPHHMLLSRRDLNDLDTHGRMNPPLRRERLRQKVYDRVVDGTVDMIATDHAPHTRAEKDASIWDAPSGVPGVETALPLLLAEAREGDLSYERVRDLTAANPAEVFGLPTKGRIAEGMDADLVLVDPGNTREIRGEDLHSKCEWTPFEGKRGVFPELTLVRGNVAYESFGPDTAIEQAESGETRSERFGDAVGRNVRTIDRDPATEAEDERGADDTTTADDEPSAAEGQADDE